MTLSLYEQYLYHARKWMSDYHLSFNETEVTSLDFMLDLELIDSKVEAAFEQKRRVTNGWKREQVFIDQIL